jgi:FlaA1/EpsC-like NDP-sugar epimerase
MGDMAGAKACRLVLEMDAMVWEGETYVLDRGKPVNIQEMASNLVKEEPIHTTINI